MAGPPAGGRGGSVACGPVATDDDDRIRATAAWWDTRHVDQVAAGRRRWAFTDICWGMFDVPETVARLLPDRLEGIDVVELGCGTAYLSAWFARRGARPVAVDPSAGQLAIARSLQHDFGVSFPLVRAAGEAVPLRDGCADLVVSEYGAAIWADPYQWIPEAARLLHPGGELVFLGNSTLLMLCVPESDDEAAADRLVRPQFGMYRFSWPDDPTVEFHLTPGEWIRLLRGHGFVIEDLVELRAPDGAVSTFPFVTAEWARSWPAEEAWRARMT